MFRASVLAGLALGAAFGASGSMASAQALADRYGPAPPPLAAAPSPLALAPSAVLRLRMLDWPGKSTPTSAAPRDASYAPPQAYAARGSTARTYAKPAYAGGSRAAPAARWRAPSQAAAVTLASASYTQPGQSAAPAADRDGWRPVFAGRTPAPAGAERAPALAGAPTPTPLPTSIYQPDAATATAQAISPASRAASLPPPRGYVQRLTPAGRAEADGVHFYSVHRAFGLQPDPAPIPPQFFTATADLSDPPGPLPTERSTASSKTGVSVHATPDTSSN